MAGISVPSLIQDSANLETQTGRQRTQGDPNAWGAQEARGLAQVGAGLEHAAQAADEIELRFDQANARELDNAYAEYERQALYDPSTGYLSQRGKNALEARPGLQAGLDARLQQLADTARSNRARAAFLAVGGERMQNALQRADTHATEQVRVYEDAASTARMDQAASTAEADFGDDTNVLRQRDIINAEVAASGRRNGYDDAIISDNQMRHDQALARGIIGMRADADPAATRRALASEHRTGVAALLSEGDRIAALEGIDRELERRATVWRSNLRDQMGLQRDQMATGLPIANPISVATVHSAFGEGAANDWEVMLRANQSVPQFNGETNQQLESRLASAPNRANVVEANLQTAQMRLAAGILEQREGDPRAYDVSQGLISNSPSVLDAITSSNWLNLGSLLSNRQGVAAERQRQLGLRPTLLTNTEASTLRQQLDSLPAQDRTRAITNLQRSVRDPRAYRSLATQLYADAPGAQLGMAVQGRRAHFRDGVSGDVAARYLFEGAAALGSTQQANTPGDQGGDRPRRAFAMPSEGDLRQAWVDRTRTAYSGSRDEQLDYEAYRAAYAGASIAAHDYSGQFDQNRARLAVDIASGGISSDGQTILPWGMQEDDFHSSIARGWANIQQHYGGDLASRASSQFRYQAVGGRYAVMYHGAQARDAHGRPVFIAIPGH